MIPVAIFSKAYVEGSYLTGEVLAIIGRLCAVTQKGVLGLYIFKLVF
jgi:hypothetical protein